MSEFVIPSAQEGHGRLMRAATYASVGVALMLVLVKFVAWLVTDSVSLLSTLIDSLLDVAASAVNLFAVRTALAPPDREHRFGHGKAEPLAAVAQATFITGSAVFLLFEAGQRLYAPHPVMHGEVGIAVMIFSIVATVALVAFQKFVIRRTRSVAIRADSLHFIGDLFVNLAVIVAILLASGLGWAIADPLFGLGIACYILYNAWLIARDAMAMLMDRELPDEDRERIKSLVLSHPGTIGLHDLKTRASGPQVFIQCHVELEGSMSLFEAHRVADEVEKQLLASFQNAEVIIHQDPV